MAEERPGSWFGFGFCGFGQALGSGHGRQVHSPELLCAPDLNADICRVSASWSYTALVSRERPAPTYTWRSHVPCTAHVYGPRAPPPAQPLSAPTGAGRLHLSGSCGGALAGCRDAWASEALLVVLRDARGTAPGPELQAWAPGSALTGEPLWAQTLELEAEREDRPGAEAQAGGLPLLPGARAYVSPRPPLCRPLAPELRARRLDLGAEHALLLDEAGCVFSWGGGR